MSPFLLFTALALVSQVQAASVETVNSEIAVEAIDRSIDISSQLVKINSKVTLVNNGRGAITGCHYVVEENVKDKLAFIGATVCLLGKGFLP